MIAAKYPLQETDSRNYQKRTKLNVQDSDGTLILNQGELSSGTAYTAHLADTMGKPYLVVGLDQSPDPQKVLAWLQKRKILTLNVAGPREDKRLGIYDQAVRFLTEVLEIMVAATGHDQHDKAALGGCGLPSTPQGVPLHNLGPEQ